MNARERGVHAHTFGAERHLEWHIRRAGGSPLDACGASQRSRFAERAQRSLNIGQRTRQKISRHENVLRLVTGYDRERSPNQRILSSSTF